MASVPGFKHNVFICYSPKDMEWRDCLVEHLRVAQGQGLLDTWDEHQLLGGDDRLGEFTQAIERGSVAVLLVSASSLSSKFIQNQAMPLILAQPTRFFPILVRDCDWQVVTWLQSISLRPRHGRPLGMNEKRDRTEEQIDFDLREIVQEIRNLPPPQPLLPAKVEASEQFTIFLADVSEKLHKVRKKLARELADKGAVLAPAVPPPDEAAPHDEAARAKMAASELCVHLFDDSPGREIEDEDEVFYPQRQLALGLELARPQLIWTAPALDWQKISDPTQRALLEDLRDGTRERTNYTFDTSTQPADLASVILGRLKALKPTPFCSPVMLDNHLRDDEIALELRRLLRACRIQSALYGWDDNPSENTEAWARRVREHRRVLIICGEVESTWVTGRVLQASGLANGENLQIRIGLYYANPQHKQAIAPGKYGRLTVYGFDEADIRNPQALQTLLAEF